MASKPVNYGISKWAAFEGWLRHASDDNIFHSSGG